MSKKSKKKNKPNSDPYKTAREEMEKRTKEIAQTIFDALDGEPSAEYLANQEKKERENAERLEELYIKTGQKQPPRRGGTWRKHLTREAIIAHQKWVQRGQTGPGRIELEEVNLSSAPARGQVFTGARFVHCNFTKADLEMAGLEGAELIECVFDRAIVSATLDGAAIDRCSFLKADLSHAHFIEADLRECNFTDSGMQRAVWEKANARRCIYANVNFEEASLDESVFTGCDFRGARLIKVDTDNPVTTNAYGTRFIRCDFSGADFTNLRLKNTIFEDCKFEGAKGKPIIEGKVEGFDLD